MNDLINAIAKDLSIPKYLNETDEHYVYRTCLSAFGNWCLKLAQSKDEFGLGSTKHNITNVLNELLYEYEKMFPFLRKMFSNEKDDEFAVLIRHLYEETGYLLTAESNKDIISNRERTIAVGSSYLYFGLPKQIKFANGLGFYCEQDGIECSFEDAFLRDRLKPSDYVNSKFENDFFDYSEENHYMYFNPLTRTSLSSSWGGKLVSNYSVAKDENNSYYRVKKDGDNLLMVLDSQVANDDSLTSYEYRRLYYALKAYYNNPVEAKIDRLDDVYSQICIPSFLPNREYYLLLLLGWPKENIFNRGSFIIKNDTIKFVSKVLSNLGIKIRGVKDEQ